VGRWSGAGAAGLGLEGAVRRDHLSLLLSGRAPSDGHRLSGRPARVGGFDLTFSAPKSVSVLFALGSAEVRLEVIEAQRAAVAAVGGYLDRRVIAVRRGTGDERRVLPAGGSIGAAFTHGVSRALDPHLHTHLVVANVTRGADGRWSALDGRGLFAHRRTMDALYRAELRLRLTATLGTAWERRGGRAPEVAGIGLDVIGAFSGRAAEVRAGTHDVGSSSARARSIARLATRDPKAPLLEHDVLVARWRRVARDAGFDARDIGDVIGRPPPSADRLDEHRLDEHRFAAALAATVHGGTTRRAVVGAWAEAAHGGGRVVETEASADWAMAFRRASPGRPTASWDPSGARGEPAAPGVAEPLVALEPVVPPGYLLHALGARPLGHAGQQRWRDAALGIERYRQRWDVGDRDDALGRDVRLAGLSVPRLADHLRVRALIEREARAMGHEPDRARDRGLSFAGGR
jgi:conjugative relaxase-like TrwC/TraI family protein